MRKFYVIFLVALLLGMSGCRRNGSVALRTGDLVFVNIPADYDLDSGSMAGAIGASTSEGRKMMTIHVAILEVKDDSTWIIDATIRHGVDRYPLDTFLTDFTLKDGSLPEFDIKRPDVSALEAEAFVENAKKFIGQPYDVHFLPDNGEMYCSELVYNSYIAPDGKHLFSSAPMNFLNEDGVLPVYWKQLFALLGEDVPQGIEGTNPQKMSAEPVLKNVRKGF